MTCVSYLQPPVVARLMGPLGRSCEGIIISWRSVKVDAFLIHKVNHVLTKSFLLALLFFPTASAVPKKSELLILKEVILESLILSFSLKNAADLIIIRGNNSSYVF